MGFMSLAGVLFALGILYLFFTIIFQIPVISRRRRIRRILMFVQSIYATYWDVSSPPRPRDRAFYLKRLLVRQGKSIFPFSRTHANYLQYNRSDKITSQDLHDDHLPLCPFLLILVRVDVRLCPRHYATIVCTRHFYLPPRLLYFFPNRYFNEFGFCARFL